MKKIIVFCMVLALAGCFGGAEFDATNDETIKASSEKITEGLPEKDRKAFQEAMMYFAIGGDIQNVFGDIMKAALAGESSEAAVEGKMKASLKDIDGLTGEEIIAKHQKRLAEDKQVRALEKEAADLMEKHEYDKALAKYKALTEIPAGATAGAKGVQDATTGKQSFVEKMGYIDNVEVTEFKAERIDTFLKKNVPAVRLSLKNNGDRSLDKVEVVVYFKDASGQVIFEEKFKPVWVSEYNFRDSKPLKAGYVHEMEQGKYHIVESALSEWEEGSATVKIVDIGFSE